MANIGYCRFQNTLPDLYDCHDHLFDSMLSHKEKVARNRLIDLCREIAEETDDFGEDVELDD